MVSFFAIVMYSYLLNTMLQILFYIRFKAQLRRTRPELIASLEDTVTKAASAAGGRIEAGRKVFTASFDEDRIGFWLDMVIFLEKVYKALAKASGELYGYVLALGRDIPETSITRLCHSTPEKDDRRGTGIWCSEEVSKLLEYYMVFDSVRAPALRPLPVEDEDSDDERPLPEDYKELLEWRSFDMEGTEPYNGYSDEPLSDIPPLAVRFGAGGCGLVCFVDAYTRPVRSFIASAVSPDQVKELDTIHALLFRERLRKDWSRYMTEQARRFIHSLFSAYIAAFKARSTGGALILEALHLADIASLKVFKEIYLSLGEGKKQLALAAGNSTSKSVTNLRNALNVTIVNAHADTPLPDKNHSKRDNVLRDVPTEVLEVSYNIFLLGRYFPDHLFPQLFQEQGLNRETYFRALAMLGSMGLLSGVFGQSGIPGFDFRGEKILPEARKEKIRLTVRKIILAWVGSGKLRPCFNLLRILLELGERAEDDLILRSIRSDIFNGSPEEIERSLGKRGFDSFVGALNAPVLTYVYKTLKSLACGEKDAIQEAFQEPVPPMMREDNKPCYEAYQAQVQINLAAFYIGIRNSDAASEAVRKAMFLNRSLGKNAIPAHRLFSLVHLARKRIDDAQEYISFAMEQSETLEQKEDQVLTCYFAASINLLYGNLSKAERIATKAEEAALAIGQADWAMRSRFLRGRVCFEIGRYKDALDIFESFESPIAGTVTHSAMMFNTVRAWLNRTKGFLGQAPADDWGGVKGGATLDWKIFEIEAAYFAADYEKAKSLAERFLSSTGKEMQELYSVGSYYGKDFLFVEQPDWRSGFAQCENMLLSEKVPVKRMAWIYRTMAQCALHPSQEAKAEILTSMQRFMREELLPDTDPNDPFYFFAWYSILRDTEAAQVDMNTAISISYKRLQRRAVRIDDTNTRQKFLSQSRWSSALCFAARENKLI